MSESSFIPRTSIIRGSGSSAAPPAPTPAAEPPAPSFTRPFSGSVTARAREAEAAWPEQTAAKLRTLRGAKRASEMRDALAAAPEPLAALRERVEKLTAERLHALRHGYPGAVPPLDEKIAFFTALAEGYALLITEFERDLPEVERREAEEHEALKTTLGALFAERDEIGARILSKQPMLVELSDDVQKYQAVTTQIDGRRAHMKRKDIPEDALGLDFTAPLVTSTHLPSAPIEAKLGYLPGDLARGLRIPGFAPRGEPAPPWLYLPR